MAVMAIRHDEGVNITQAAQRYADRTGRNPTAVLRAVAWYWREIEKDDEDDDDRWFNVGTLREVNDENDDD
jgi:hypothetical protein